MQDNVKRRPSASSPKGNPKRGNNSNHRNDDYDTTPFPFWSIQNLLNAILCVLVALPIIYEGYVVFNQCPVVEKAADQTNFTAEDFKSQLYSYFCYFGLYRPIIFVNLVFFFNVCVLFWLINIFQNSTWLIDPYWTLAPLLIAHYYSKHPLAEYDPTRSSVSLILLWIWSIRLTHNYLRGESYRFGAHEDWRFAKMRKEKPVFFRFIAAFYTAFLSQQPMLVGITLPFWAIHHTAGSPAWDVYDILISVGCVAGLTIAGFADNQLRAFKKSNAQREKNGQKKILVLDFGIWRYSRHPNYFGEQLWWWSVAMWGVRLGHPWVIVGTFFNSIILYIVTSMTEERIIGASEERSKLYAVYKKRTSMWVPWFKKGSK